MNPPTTASLESAAVPFHSLPRPQPTTIDRPRLVRALHPWRSLRLIRIVAPAGYGKTTFAASWVHSLDILPPPERPRCAWLTLDAHVDAEHIADRIIERLAACDTHLEQLLAARGAGDSSGKVGLLCKLLQDQSAPILLVVDNAHLLEGARDGADALVPLQQLIDHAPDQLLIMLVSRTALDLRIADLILRDEVVTLDERAMALDPDEFQAFIRTAGFDSLDHDMLSSLESQTRGWIAGLKLLAHHYKYSGERLPADAFSGAGPSALRRFLEKLVEAFSPEERRALLAAALLPWVTPALLAALSGSSVAESTHILQNIARRFTFLMPYEPDADHLAWRLHPLLRDFLRESASPPPDARDDMRFRAAVWLLRHDHLDDALDLLDAGRMPAAADLLAERMRVALLDYDISALQRWLRRIPTDLLERHPGLAVVAAWTMRFAVSPDADAALTRAEQAAARSPESTPELRAELLALRGLQQMSGGTTSPLVPLVAQIEPLVGESPSLAAGYLCAFRGWAMVDPISSDAHVHHIQRAVDIFERIGFRYGAIEAAVSLGMLKRRTGNAHGAIYSLRTAEHILSHTRWSLSHIAIMVQCMLGEQLYFTNQIEHARTRLHNAVRIDGYENLLPEFGYLATLLAELCDLAEGRAVSPSEQDFAAWSATLQNPLPQTIGAVAMTRILRDFRRGAPEACLHTVEQLRILPHQLSAEHPDSIWLAVLGGMVLGGRVDAVLGPLLESTEARCRAENFDSLALQVRVVRILHEQALGELDRALTLAEDFFGAVERTGLHRLVLDHPALHALLVRCRTPFTQKLLAHMQAGHTNALHAFLLSTQETRIVRLLLSGHTTEGVAQSLNVSVETVRSHLRRIFVKMNVHSRDEMLDIARVAGLHR